MFVFFGGVTDMFFFLQKFSITQKRRYKIILQIIAIIKYSNEKGLCQKIGSTTKNTPSFIRCIICKILFSQMFYIFDIYTQPNIPRMY